MDWLSRIFDWLREQEAGFSALAAILVIVGVLFAGLRALHLRGATERLRKALAGSTLGTRLIAAGAGALLIVAGVAAWLMLPDEPETEVATEDDPVLALPTGPMVAVLPFENLSEDPKQEFFSDGLTDGIITALSRFKDLFVIARNSAFRYKGQAVDVRKLREELGARYVVEGSVQKAGETLRVTAQLLDAKDGTHLWADSYDRDLSTSNLFAIQDEITEQVVGTIAGLSGVISRARFAEVKDRPTDSLDAYESVLPYRAYFRGTLSESELEKARAALEHAVKSDPSYADAWAYLALLYLEEYRHNYIVTPDPLDRALEAARRAVALDSTSQSAHHALAEVHYTRHELDAFFAEAERAIALNPNNPGVVAVMGVRLHYVGDDQGIALVRKAMKLDPFHPTWYHFPIAAYHFERGEYKAALTAARKLDLPGYFWTRIFLAGIYAELGRQSEARVALEELVNLYPSFNSEKLAEEWRKWNLPDDRIQLWVVALRKAGLPD